MEKVYKEIELPCGRTIEDAVLALVKHGSDGEFVCCDFNGHMLHSDTVSIDSAYLQITGKTYFEVLIEKENNRKQLIKEEKEYQDSLPDQVRIWIDNGHAIIDKKYWSEWDKCVPIRLADLYHGMELDDCLVVIKALNDGHSLIEAKDIIENQNHSGMSYSIVLHLVKTFCDRGIEFYNFVEQ